MQAEFIRKHYYFLEDLGIQATVKIRSQDVHVKAFYLPPNIFNSAPLLLLTTDIPENDSLEGDASQLIKRALGLEISSMDLDAADDLLATLDAAESLKDLSPLKSVGLHKLSGDRAGQWAMTVNGPWRICFRFKDGDAYDVEITDYHKG